MDRDDTRLMWIVVRGSERRDTAAGVARGGAPAPRVALESDGASGDDESPACDAHGRDDVGVALHDATALLPSTHRRRRRRRRRRDHHLLVALLTQGAAFTHSLGYSLDFGL